MLARRVILVAGSVAIAVAYGFIAAALNRPPAAHAPPVDALGATTTTVGALAAGDGPIAITTTTTLPLVHPGPLHAPRVGAYALHVTTNGAETDATLFVEKDGSQRFAVGNVTHAVTFRWTKTRGELVRTGNATGDDSCVWSPPPVFIAAKLTEGRAWRSDSTCVTSAGDATLTIRRQETAKVMRGVRAQVRSEPLDAWLIERHVITTSRGPAGTVVFEETSSELFAPRIGLNIYTLRRTDTPRADGGIDSVTEAIELRAATPA